MAWRWRSAPAAPLSARPARPPAVAVSAGMQHRSSAPGLHLFFGLTLGLTWVAWAPAALSRSEPDSFLFVVGGLSPSLWGVVLTLHYQGRAGLRDLVRRSFDPGLIPARWWLPLLLLYPLLMALSLSLGLSMGVEPTALTPLEGARLPLGELVPLIVVLVVAGPLSEELGWSGFALDRLQRRWSALVSSLILSVFGILWHLPLFFMEGTSQGEMGFGSALFVAWVVRHTTSKVFRTWAYNNTDRSVLATVVVHFMGNFTFTMVAGLGGAVPLGVEGVNVLLQLGAAAAVLSWWGPARLVRRNGRAA